MNAHNFSPKHAWPPTGVKGFNAALADIKPLSAYAGDPFVDKGIVYLQPDLNAAVKAFMSDVAPANRYSWLVSYRADGDADLAEVLQVHIVLDMSARQWKLWVQSDIESHEIL